MDVGDYIGIRVKQVKDGKDINLGDTEILTSSRCSDLSQMATVGRKAPYMSQSDDDDQLYALIHVVTGKYDGKVSLVDVKSLRASQEFDEVSPD